MTHVAGPWSTWERHPAGAEVVIACTGTHRFVQEVNGAERVVEIGPGQALINRTGRVAHRRQRRGRLDRVHHTGARDGAPAAVDLARWPPVGRSGPGGAGPSADGR